MVTPATKRSADAHLVEAYEMSERRACRAIGADRSSMRYEARRPDDAALRTRLRELAYERRRFGSRRLHALLRREGHLVNRKRVQRLYVEERLHVCRRRGRKRALGVRAPIAVPDRARARWSVDFVHDQMTDGRRFRVLAVVDDCTRECLGLVLDTSISGARAARGLDAVIARRGPLKAVISDNGTEFTSNAVLGWADARGVAWQRIQPGKPSRDTRSPRASSGDCGMSSSTRHCSVRCTKPVGSWTPGGPTTTPCARTPGWAGSPRTSTRAASAARLNRGPVRLQMTRGSQSRLDERWGSRHGRSRPPDRGYPVCTRDLHHVDGRYRGRSSSGPHRPSSLTHDGRS